MTPERIAQLEQMLERGTIRKGHIAEMLDAIKQRPEERNFCPRCGKRTADLTTIHTCTPPPQEKNA